MTDSADHVDRPIAEDSESNIRPARRVDSDAKTARAERFDAFAEASRELELVVLRGPDRGARCPLSASHPAPLLIGQSATCDFRLTDRSISRRHAAIDASEWPVRVRDLGSTNGTFVNGVAIVEARLSGGETLCVGDTTIVANLRAPAPRARLVDWISFGRTLGKSAVMRRLYPQCERIAASAASTLIEGEPGTGKELLAESIHEQGPRAAAPFVVIDCALGAGELARRQRDRGDAFERLVAQAGSGTLLLDEPGELDAPLQRSLARALTAGPRTARILVTTRKDLDSLVQHGRFREDLYTLLSNARLELPPLRARRGDVPHLAYHFWLEGGGDGNAFPSDVIARAETQPWPGNVRELRELVTTLIVPGTADGLEASSFGARASDRSAELAAVIEEILCSDVSYAGARRRLLVEFEQRYVERMLLEHNGNITRAAAASGLARRNFQLIRARRRDPR
jgi:transcriptional regulator of acetoin/glycerol metabolism